MGERYDLPPSASVKIGLLIQCASFESQTIPAICQSAHMIHRFRMNVLILIY